MKEVKRRKCCKARATRGRKKAEIEDEFKHEEELQKARGERQTYFKHSSAVVDHEFDYTSLFKNLEWQIWWFDSRLQQCVSKN
jgi:hypothetical protein